MIIPLVILLNLVWILHLKQEVESKIIHSPISLIIILLDILLIVIAGSRIAFFSAIICLLYYFFKNIKRKLLFAAFLSTILFISGNLLSLNNQLYGNRLFGYFELRSRLSTLSEIQDIRPFGLGIGTAIKNDYFGTNKIITDHSLHNSFIIIFMKQVI